MGQSQFPSLVVENPDVYAQQHSLEIDEGKKDQNYMSKLTIAMVQMGDLKVILSETVGSGRQNINKDSVGLNKKILFIYLLTNLRGRESESE